MARSITTIRHKAQLEELPCYRDLYEFLDALKKAANIPGSMMHNLNNLYTLLEQAGMIVTTERREQEDAIERLNELLR